MARRIYKTPPIDDAVCEFRFAQPPEGRDITLLGRLYESLKSEYPNPPKNQTTTDVELSTQPGQQTLKLGDSVPLVRLVGKTQSQLLTFGTRSLAVNSLRPYEGWESFRHRISHALGTYWDIFDPIGVTRIGIRYINRIRLPEDLQAGVRLERYFNYFVHHPIGLPETVATFIVRTEYSYPDGIRLALTHGPIPSESSAFEMLLDLDVFIHYSRPHSRNGLLEVLDRLRTIEREAFEVCITDDTRALFDAD
jgi:uncharacterized protein (TIGR04255 family)